MTTEASTDLCELFARVVEQFPHNLAVDHTDGRLTYRELDEVSSTLANDLRRLHVSEGCPVLLLTAHGTLNIVAILAILKTGGFFVPIDRNTWSQDAIRYVFDTVDSQVAVNTTPEPFTPPDGRSYHVLHLSQLPPDHHGQFNHTLPPVFRSTPAERTACTIFTSGSTGRAKGVMISHRSLALYAKMSPANLDIQPGDRLLHLLSVAFDASTCILFSALLNGGTVVPANPDQVYDLSSSCTVMASTPSLLNHLPRPTPDQGSLMYARMHSILLGGETCTSELLESWIDAGVRVWTAYGATETTSMGFIRKVERDALAGDIELAVIGKPMALSHVWLLDSNLGIVEDNFAEGEIVIGGDGVAQGYYKDKTKTADAFIWWNGRRVYKTGDYGRWVPARGVSQDRVFEFRGRRDRTVKNRGFLVNLDRDVEDCLYRAGASLGVRSVRAAMAENGIVAVVSPSWVDTTALLTQAKHSMYAYCIPYRIVAVDDFPLSPNGKAQLRSILDIFVAVDQARMDQTPNATIGKETRTPTDSAEKQEPEKAQGKLERILRAATEVLRQPGEELRKIRPEQTFVEVGGSSLLALKLISSLRQLDLNVSVRDLFACHTFSDIAELASTTTLSKGTANLNLGKESEATPELPRIPANLTAQVRTALNLAADEDIEVAPLTSLQLELAIPTLAETSRSVNQVRLSYKGVWAGAMERAWRAAWQSEPVFKAQICLDVGSGVQVVRKRAPKAPTREVFHSRQEYDTAVGGPSMAVGLGARLDFLAYQPPAVASDETSGADEEGLTVVLTVHHSLMDGCSLKQLIEKLEQAALGWPFGTSPSPVHANLALISTQQSRDAEARAFFHSYLKDMPLPLPSRRSSAAAERQHHGIAKAALFEPSVDIDEVTAFASSHCVSTACVYYTAWAMAMSVFERCAQVVVGAVFSSRGALPAEHEDALGLYMSTLPLAFRFENTNETVVARLQHTMGDLTTVGEYAWARSDQVGLGRNLRNLLSMQLPLPGEHSRPPAVRAESLENSDFPLSMLVEANGSLRLLYDETQFDTTTVRRLGEHFKHALSGLIREHRVEDCMRISRLHETLLDHTEGVGIESDGRFTVKRALEEAMDQFADLPALEDCSGTTVLSYGELNRLTETITHQINALCGDTSQNNRPVAVHGDGSVEWVLGTLAVVKTGRTFVPLDPKWPIGRRAAVCEQSGATALILVPRASQVGEAPAIPGMRVLAVDSILSSSAEPSNNTPGPLDDAPSPDDLLTIVFTSGTTGAPKGVPLSHQGFLALQSTPEGRMFAAPGRRVAQFMSPAFDVCNAEMFSTLLHGATLVLRDPLDPFAHLARVNTASMTPSVLATLELDRFPSLEVIYATGEPLTSGLMSQFAEGVLLYNAYGPAECIIWSSMTRMIPGDRLTIGTGLDTARMYVLDEDQHHSPDSTRGEIYVAGVQVLSSYINSPEQTAERIMPDPWHPGHRMYKTGDYGIRGRDGRIVFQGRIDRQVKIRGFRVELPGVEQAILSGPADEGISQCAAMAIHDTLVAFVALDNNHPDPEEERIARLRDRLADTLLPSWVPQIILPLEEGFPRTANDKADTRALEAAYASRVASHQSPSIETLSSTAEEGSITSASSTSEDNSSHIRDELAIQWRRVLQLQHDTPIKESDDFISLGGHSVLLMLLATRLSATFGVSISVRHLVTTPSFQAQVELVERLLVQVEGNEVKASPEELKTATLRTEDLTELERLVWFQCQVAPNPVVFNIAMVLNLQGTVDLQRLEYSLNVALASDPVVRSNFVEGPDGLRRRLRESAPKVRRFVELNEEAEASRHFDLKTDELIRVYMVAPLDTANEARPVRLLIVTTHVIADLGTLQNLLQLASTAYSKTTAAVAIAKHERPAHLDLARWTQHPSLEAQEFWKTYLGGHCYHANKPPILPSSSQTLFQGTSQTYPFSGRLVTPLNALLRRLGVTHHQLALTAAALTMQWLSRKTGNEQDDIVLGAPHAGRSSPAERHHVLGQFLDRLPVRVRLGVEEGEKEEEDGKTTTTMTTLLTRVRDSAREALANAIPFSAILAALDYPRGGLRHPLFECMVTFHARGAGLENWMQLGPAPHGGGGGGGVSVTSTPVFVPGVAKFPLMLEWFERGGCEEADDNWMLHMELQDVDKNAENTHRLAGVLKNALEIVFQALADECSIVELRRRLDGLQLPDGMPWMINGKPAADNRRDVCNGYFRPEVVQLASKIRDEMLGCLGDTGMGPNTQTLARKLRKALGTSFFEAGADSVDALMLRHRLRETLGLEMSLRDVFVAQSPLGLAQRVLQ